ncbi:hypothetical protein AB0K09_32490 [Streptomyces sp. NPDC049577]|uniref:hypothetical protein n=1 Tax=Streptomyces sp. NPDC049577 TaxID=3155153 RepID=UPI0034178947
MKRWILAASAVVAALALQVMPVTASETAGKAGPSVVAADAPAGNGHPIPFPGGIKRPHDGKGTTDTSWGG